MSRCMLLVLSIRRSRGYHSKVTQRRPWFYVNNGLWTFLAPTSRRRITSRWMRLGLEWVISEEGTGDLIERTIASSPSKFSPGSAWSPLLINEATSTWVSLNLIQTSLWWLCSWSTLSKSLTSRMSIGETQQLSNGTELLTTKQKELMIHWSDFKCQLQWWEDTATIVSQQSSITQLSKLMM